MEMLELFLECMPEYNIDRPDGEGKHRVVNHREYAETGVFMILCFRQHSFAVGLYQRQWRPLQGPGNLEINFV